ncbi:hypothetical protein LY76DRAFT_360771 [Colletotrichum caudatum]|nr:hypothetical protein LY76DRAFT_360771 [Colletotrichum caudatum]
MSIIVCVPVKPDEGPPCKQYISCIPGEVINITTSKRGLGSSKRSLPSAGSSEVQSMPRSFIEPAQFPPSFFGVGGEGGTCGRMVNRVLIRMGSWKRTKHAWQIWLHRQECSWLRVPLVTLPSALWALLAMGMLLSSGSRQHPVSLPACPRGWSFLVCHCLWGPFIWLPGPIPGSWELFWGLLTCSVYLS